MDPVYFQNNPASVYNLLVALFKNGFSPLTSFYVYSSPKNPYQSALYVKFMKEYS